MDIHDLDWIKLFNFIIIIKVTDYFIFSLRLNSIITQYDKYNNKIYYRGSKPSTNMNRM